MRRFSLKPLSGSFQVVSVLGLLSCSGGESTGPKVEPTPVVGSVSVTLPRSAMHVGDSAQAVATVLSTNSSVISGRIVTWSTENASVATVGANGMVTAIGLGTARISAATDGKAGQATLSITVIPIASITFVQDTASVLVGRAVALNIVVKDSVGNTTSGRQIAWATSDPSKATVSNTGVATGLAVGTADITASAEGKTGLVRVRILPIVGATSVASVSVSIPRTAFRVGESLQAAALPLDSLGGVLTGRTIVWSSNSPQVAAVTAGGLVTGVGSGLADISAEVENRAGRSTVQVSLVPVASVSVTPATESISAGASALLSTVLKDSADRILSGRAVTWTSTAPSVASVSETGAVTAILVGTTEIVATSEGKQGRASITVNTLNTPVGTITISPGFASMSGGGMKQLTATLRDVNGNVLGGRNIAWTSSNPARATVSPTGAVTASPVDGPVVISATVEGKSASSSIDIVTFVRLSAARGVTCGLNAAGTSYCWPSGPQRTPAKVPTDLKFVAISSGPFNTCALDGSGVAYCGISASGAPVLVPGGYRFVSIAVGQESTCATTSEAELYCWGTIRYDWDDGYGGNGNSSQQSVPLRMTGGLVAVVAGSDNAFCSVDGEGYAYCGRPAFYTPRNGPTVFLGAQKVSSTLRFTTVRVGWGHACGLVATGQAYCWGRNDRGQLGDATTTANGSPVLVAGGLLFESIAAGGSWDSPLDGSPTIAGGVSCGITLGAKAYCWGANRFGQLGIGSQGQSVSTPQPVAGGLSFTGIRSGGYHSCGLAVGGAAYCWGDNQNGVLGDGSIVSSSTPTAVFGR